MTTVYGNNEKMRGKYGVFTAGKINDLYRQIDNGIP